MGADKVLSPLLSSCPYLILSVSNIGFLIAGVSLIPSIIPSPPLYNPIPSPLLLSLTYLQSVSQYRVPHLIPSPSLYPSPFYVLHTG